MANPNNAGAIGSPDIVLALGARPVRISINRIGNLVVIHGADHFFDAVKGDKDLEEAVFGQLATVIGGVIADVVVTVKEPRTPKTLTELGLLMARTGLQQVTEAPSGLSRRSKR